MAVQEREMKGAGGTPGGVTHFIVGLIMALIGCFLLMDRVQVTSGFWSFYGYGGFGIVLIPFLFGVAMLFFNGKSVFGWVLMTGGFLVIIVGIIANLTIHFMPTSLFNTLVILVLLVGGLGLILRSLRPYG